MSSRFLVVVLPVLLVLVVDFLGLMDLIHRLYFRCCSRFLVLPDLVLDRHFVMLVVILFPDSLILVLIVDLILSVL